MFECTPFNLFRSRRKNPRQLRNAATIEIRSIAPDNTETWRAAVLSSDPKSAQNIVSQRLVTDVLGQPIQPLDKEGIAKRDAQNHPTEEVDGYVDLVWSMEEKRNIHTTRFFVSSVYDPPYDAVLGKADSMQYDMLKRSKGRPTPVAKR